MRCANWRAAVRLLLSNQACSWMAHCFTAAGRSYLKAPLLSRAAHLTGELLRVCLPLTQTRNLSVVCPVRCKTLVNGPKESANLRTFLSAQNPRTNNHELVICWKSHVLHEPDALSSCKSLTARPHICMYLYARGTMCYLRCNHFHTADVPDRHNANL